LLTVGYSSDTPNLSLFLSKVAPKSELMSTYAIEKHTDKIPIEVIVNTSAFLYLLPVITLIQNRCW